MEQVQPERRVQYEQRLDNLLSELSKVSGSIGSLSGSHSQSHSQSASQSQSGAVSPSFVDDHLALTVGTSDNNSDDHLNNDDYSHHQNFNSNSISDSSKALRESAPALMYTGGNNNNVRSSPSTFILSPPSVNSGYDGCQKNKHYFSQIPANNNNNNNKGSVMSTSANEQTLLVLSPPSSSCESENYQHHQQLPATAPYRNQYQQQYQQQHQQQQADCWSSSDSREHQQCHTSTSRSSSSSSKPIMRSNNNNNNSMGAPGGATAAAAAATTRAATSRRLMSTNASREDTCDSTKYSSDTDTTMSGGSASASNDFLSRLEQQAAKQPGSSTAPLPFSYLAMANNNNNISSSSPTLESRAMTTSRISPPQQNGSSYYVNNINNSSTGAQNRSRNGVDYGGYADYNDNDNDDDDDEIGGLMTSSQHQQQHHRQPPPPPPLPRTHQNHGHFLQQQNHRNQTAPMRSYSPASSSVSTLGGSSYQPGPGAGVFAHAQYNSPIGIYSNDSAAEAFRMQSGGVVTNVTPLQRQTRPAQELQSTPLYKLIQEEENRQQRRRQAAFQRNGGQLSVDESYLNTGYSNNINNEQPTPSGRRITTMTTTMPRQRPGSSLAHFATPGTSSTPRDAYDQVLATLPRRPNRWSAKAAEASANANNHHADLDRQAALRQRCSSATRCLMTSSPVEQGPLIDDRAIRYRGAKIPSRTFQLLHAYTEFTAKEDDKGRVVPDKTLEQNQQQQEPVATVVISERPRIRQRPASERPVHHRIAEPDPSEFERGAIQGDGPPRHAVPSRSFMALQAVLGIHDDEKNNQSENGDKEASNGKNGTNGEGDEGATAKQANGDTNGDASSTNGHHEENSDQQNGDEPKPDGELPSQFNGIIRQPAQQRQAIPVSQPQQATRSFQPLKVPIVPTRIRPSVPRAPTWDRQPFRHEVTSMRTPASSKAPANNHGGYYAAFQQQQFQQQQQQPQLQQRQNGNGGGAFNDSFHDTASSNGSSTNVNNGGSIDEPYRLAKLKVMTKGAPLTQPRSASRNGLDIHYARQQRTGTNTTNKNNMYAHLGDATDF